jgi:hypothetical protein
MFFHCIVVCNKASYVGTDSDCKLQLLQSKKETLPSGNEMELRLA